MYTLTPVTAGLETPQWLLTLGYGDHKVCSVLSLVVPLMGIKPMWLPEVTCLMMHPLFSAFSPFSQPFQPSSPPNKLFHPQILDLESISGGTWANQMPAYHAFSFEEGLRPMCAAEMRILA